MEDRTLYDHWLVLRRSMPILLVTTLVAGATAWGLSRVLPQVYESVEEFSIVPESQPAFFTPGGGTLRAPLAPLLIQDLQKWYQATLESHAIRARVAEAVKGVDAAALEREVDVEVTRRHVVRVTVRNYDADMALAIASAYPVALNEFIEASSRQRQERTMKSASDALARTEEQILAVRARLATVLRQGRTPGLLRELERLGERKTALEGDAQRIQARVEGQERRVALTSEQLAAEARSARASGGALLAGPVQRLILEVSDLETELAGARAEFDGKLGERHPRVRILVARLEQKRADLEKQVAAVESTGSRPADSLFEQLRREFLSASRERDASRAELAATNASLEQLSQRIQSMQGNRESEELALAEINRLERMRDTLALRIRETQVMSLSPADLVVRLTPATRAAQAKFPLPVLNMLIGACLGLIGGMYLAFFNDWLVRSRLSRT